MRFLFAFGDCKERFRLPPTRYVYQNCALLNVVSFSIYEKTTPAKRTITATAGIQHEKSGAWVHKLSAFYRFFCWILMIGYIIRRGKFANFENKIICISSGYSKEPSK